MSDQDKKVSAGFDRRVMWHALKLAFHDGYMTRATDEYETRGLTEGEKSLLLAQASSSAHHLWTESRSKGHLAGVFGAALEFDLFQERECRMANLERLLVRVMDLRAAGLDGDPNPVDVRIALWEALRPFMEDS